LVSDQHADDLASLEAFKVQGIHLEILSTELLCDIHAAREPMTDHTLSMVLDTLSDVSLLATRARHEVPPEAWHQFSATVRRAQLTVQRCQTLLASGQAECDHVRVPVDVATMVRAAIMETRAIADEWGTVISVNLAANLPIVAANPHQLRQVIAATIAVLVEHAPENSRIDINAATESNHVLLTIENPSCGMALDRLATGRGLVDRPPSEAERLMLARQWLSEWGGDLQLQAELGEGARVQLTLPAFDWSDLRETPAASDVDPCPTS
jgi:light-regulated signal transduction histidine kinase (bacteriophytochrome)